MRPDDFFFDETGNRIYPNLSMETGPGEMPLWVLNDSAFDEIAHVFPACTGGWNNNPTRDNFCAANVVYGEYEPAFIFLKRKTSPNVNYETAIIYSDPLTVFAANMATNAGSMAAAFRISTPDGDWDSNGVDRATELTQILTRSGITDLSKLQLVMVTTITYATPWIKQTELGLAFKYDNRYFGYLGTPDEPSSDYQFQITAHGYLCAWSARGHGHIDYVVVPKNGRFEIRPEWGSSFTVEWRTALQMLATFASIAYGIAGGVSASSVVGSAIIGASNAAQYPALANFIGQVAISTALNGGNVETALKNAALSYVAGTAGSFSGEQVAHLTNSDLLGKVGAAVVSAYINGGNINQAAAAALIRNGATSLDSIFGGSDYTNVFDNPISLTPNYFDPTGWGDTSNLPTFTDPVNFFDDGGFTTFFPSSPSGQSTLPSLYQPVDFGGGNGVVDFGSGTGTNTTTNVAPVVTQNSSGGVSFSDIVKNASSAALAAISVLAAYKKLEQITVNPYAQTASTGRVVTTGDNGLTVTRDASGKIISTTKTPVNVATATSSGNFVVNNGDGTYTVVKADGTTATQRYAEAFNLSSSSPLLLGAAGVLGLLLFSRARK